LKTIVTVVGARPQFIKAATISRLIRRRTDAQEILIHTGQHYDPRMSAVFFDELKIPAPEINLEIGSLSHGAQTGRMLERLEQVLMEVAPDWLLVYGDTNSTLAGALAAAKLHIRVAHVEAGLRSFNKRMPEEVNRILTDHVSDLLFTPTRAAERNLVAEGINPSRIKVVGDVMYDAALFYGERAQRESGVLARLGLHPHAYLLATVHRAENTDDPQRLRVIFSALDRVARRYPVVLPLHPRTRGKLSEQGIKPARITLIEPVGYLDMVMLEKNALTIITDSGGVQKEAYFHGVPCVTLRDETEWEELVDSGWNRLVTLQDETRTAAEIELAIISKPGAAPAFYGNGQAANAILTSLLSPNPASL